MSKIKIHIKKLKAFTLVEMTLVALILWLLLPSIFSMYNFIIRSNKEINARQKAIQQWYEFFERLNILIQNYSIDYEEYYNRQMVWCVNSWWVLTWSDFEWNVWLSGYCSEFTAYWNNNSTWRKKNWNPMSTNWWDIYYCSSERNQGPNNHKTVVKNDNNTCGRIGNRQSFGQYAALFTDVKGDNAINHTNIVWDSDDEELWRILNDNVNAIEDSDHVQEIYLISHDGKNRLYFRRKIANKRWEFNQYKIQVLRLKWFDAWQKHNFNETTNNEWLYDGVIDTWACDASMWFNCSWPSVLWAYSDYNLPNDADDWWIDFTYWPTTVSMRNIWISPKGDSDLFRSLDSHQINPSMRIMVVNWVYIPYDDSSLSNSISDFKVPLQTTINMKDFYEEY